ncbi:MAG: hypothetical protein WAX04_02195 [Oscillospiraceae bacterium]
METLLRILASTVNNLHDFIIVLTSYFGLNLSDKDLHFWVIGIIGVAVFILSDIVFRIASKWNISVISFIYTLTILIVFVFALEIEQQITGRGNMELNDIVAGLWGFFVLFGCYLVIRAVIYAVRNLIKKNHGK